MISFVSWVTDRLVADDVCRNTWEDSDTRGSLTTAQGELNLTADGLDMLRNAIVCLLSSPTRYEWL